MKTVPRPPVSCRVPVDQCLQMATFRRSRIEFINAELWSKTNSARGKKKMYSFDHNKVRNAVGGKIAWLPTGKNKSIDNKLPCFFKETKVI